MLEKKSRRAPSAISLDADKHVIAAGTAENINSEPLDF